MTSLQRHTTNHILMIRPYRFDLNEETMASNAFQQQNREESTEEIQQKALEEFDRFVGQLRNIGIEVIVIEDHPKPFTPDAVFPNNWISFHNDGRVIVYPMQAPSRRAERRMDIVVDLKTKHGFQVNDVVDIATNNERDALYLEGTGSLVLDHIEKIAYACLSPRTHTKALAQWSDLSGYRTVNFVALDQNKQQIYHTNVLMCLGIDFAIICLDAISNSVEREMVVRELAISGREIVTLTFDQMNAFAGNMLQVDNNKGQQVLILSQASYDVLRPEQIAILQKFNDHLLPISIPTIEKYGGGSVRCMMAEIFLPLQEA